MLAHRNVKYILALHDFNKHDKHTPVVISRR